jgi:protein-tyrosine phosphatase
MDGVNTFVCLCSELPDTTKEFIGGVNHPYFPNYKYYTNVLKTIKPDCKFIYIPIHDGNVCAPKDLLEHLKLLVKLIQEKNILYIHCAGGHGRTNIYTSILTSIL